MPLFEDETGRWVNYRISANRRYEDTEKYRRRRWNSLLAEYEATGSRSPILQERLVQLNGRSKELGRWLSALARDQPESPSARVLERMVQLVVDCASRAADLWLAECRPISMSGESTAHTSRGPGVMDEDMLDRLTGYVSLRNAIVHDYDLVTASTVRQGAERLAQDVPALIQALLRS